MSLKGTAAINDFGTGNVTQYQIRKEFDGSAFEKLFGKSWLETCLIPELKPDKVVVMDNYCIHKTAKAKEITENAGYKILFLPLYSLDFNPIENYWAIIKSRIKKVKSFYNDFQKVIDLAF